MDYSEVHLLKAVMNDVDRLWSVVSGEAGLIDEERVRLALAIEADEGLDEELTYLLRHLRADLSASFLRAFVDRLAVDPEDLAGATFAIRPALESVLVPETARSHVRPA